MPVLFRPANLVDDGAEEDEHVLQEDSNSRPLNANTWDDIASKEYPAGTNEGAKAEHEAEEEPDPCPIRPNAAVSVHVSTHLSITHCVHHEHGQGGNNSTDMVGVVEVFILWVLGSGINDAPPPQSKQASRHHGGQEVASLPRVPILTYGRHVLCDGYAAPWHLPGFRWLRYEVV